MSSLTTMPTSQLVSAALEFDPGDELASYEETHAGYHFTVRELLEELAARLEAK